MGFLLFQPGQLARHIAALAMGFGALCACEPVESSNYEPRSALQPDAPTVYRAVRFYDQDVPTIFQAGGRIIGDLEDKGNLASSLDDVDEDALAQAAAQGGTHLIRTSKDVQSIFLQLSRARADTDCTATPSAAHCSTVVSDPTFLKIAELPRAHYTIVFVPCENWDRLPGALRPTGFKGCEHDDPTFVVKTVNQRDIAAPRDATQLVPSSTADATTEPSASATSGEMPGSDPAQIADFTDENCKLERRPAEYSPFDRAAAKEAFQSAERESLKCDWTDRDVTLVVTFGQAGCARQAHVDDDEHDVKFDKCVLRAFSKVSVPAFRGKAVSISKHLGGHSP